MLSILLASTTVAIVFIAFLVIEIRYENSKPTEDTNPHRFGSDVPKHPFDYS